MKKYSVCVAGLLLCLCMIAACKKDKTYTAAGRILKSRTEPLPVGNYAFQFYQGGSGGAPIPIGSSSASADGATDANGYFSVRFTTGSGTVFGIPTANNSSVSLTGYGNAVFGLFRVEHINFNTLANEPLYLYKRIDTVYLKLLALQPIVPADSFTIYAYNASGSIRRVKRGFSAAVNTELLLDTLINAVFPVFDFYSKTYRNSIAITKNNYLFSYTGLPVQDSLPPVDERSRTCRYNAY